MKQILAVRIVLAIKKDEGNKMPYNITVSEVTEKLTVSDLKFNFY